MIQVLLVNGQEEVRRGLRMRLDIEPDIAVVGETSKAGEAAYLAQALGPNVIVVDAETKGGSGRLIRRLRAAAPHAAIIVLTLHRDADARVRAEESGAEAFLEKNTDGKELLQAIRKLGHRQPLAAAGRTRQESAGAARERI
jgi:DNA-binding NarL/FixJ family response regulator